MACRHGPTHRRVHRSPRPPGIASGGLFVFLRAAPWRSPRHAPSRHAPSRHTPSRHTPSHHTVSLIARRTIQRAPRNLSRHAPSPPSSRAPHAAPALGIQVPLLAPSSIFAHSKSPRNIRILLLFLSWICNIPAALPSQPARPAQSKRHARFERPRAPNAAERIHHGRHHHPRCHENRC